MDEHDGIQKKLYSDAMFIHEVHNTGEAHPSV